MAMIAFKSKKITLSANDVATIQYIKSQIEPITGRDTLTDIDVIRFALNFFIRVDEAIEKVYDTLYEEVKENEKSKR